MCSLSQMGEWRRCTGSQLVSVKLVFSLFISLLFSMFLTLVCEVASDKQLFFSSTCKRQPWKPSATAILWLQLKSIPAPLLLFVTREIEESGWVLFYQEFSFCEWVPWNSEMCEPQKSPRCTKPPATCPTPVSFTKWYPGTVRRMEVYTCSVSSLGQRSF